MGRLISMLALVAVLGGLGAYIYFVEAERPASGLEEKEKVFTVESDKIEELTVTAEGETATLRKADGTWKLTAPVQADADTTEISSLTSALTSLEVTRVVEENASDLSNYGLASPRIQVAFKAEGGASGQIALGDKTATGSDLYAVRPGESRVFLVPSYQESSLAKKPFDLREKRVLRFERDKVDSIEIAGDGPTVQLGRTDSVWSVRQPVQARGDYSAIEGLITKLSSANMTKLVDDLTDPAGLGLDKPAVRVTLGAGSTRATLVVGKEEDGAVYAEDPARKLVFAIDPTLAADLKKGAAEYRDKNLFEFRSFNVDRLRLTRGSQTSEFQKVAASGEGGTEKWQRVDGGKTVDVDTAKMDEFLSKATSLRAQSFEDAPVASPDVVVAASYDNGKFERVRLAKKADPLASREAEPGAAKLDAPAYDEMIQALDALLAAPEAAAPPAK